MARIRTVKPEFFKHEGLYELGVGTRFGPLIRVVYVGLWCHADREGRFRWRPRRLKLEVCPWDDVDFEAILAALVDAGYVRLYKVGGEEYGWLPTFRKHQRPNHREAQSEIPAHPDDDSRPGGPGQDEASPGAPGGKGTGTGPEGNGKELEQELSPTARPVGSSFKRGRSSLEWDKSLEVMRGMGFDEDTIARVERCSLDDIDLSSLIRDVFDNRRVKNKAAYTVGAIKKMGGL